MLPDPGFLGPSLVRPHDAGQITFVPHLEGNAICNSDTPLFHRAGVRPVGSDSGAFMNKHPH